ncbi:hypothetical protein FRB99_008677, partial [Tulasnella sp. 403]
FQRPYGYVQTRKNFDKDITQCDTHRGLLSFEETSTSPLGIQHYADNALNATVHFPSWKSAEYNIPKSLSLRTVTPPNSQ